LSGFEMSMMVMPLVKGGRAEPSATPGRIRQTRKALVTAALIMSAYLLGSSLVTSILIPPPAFFDGTAANRALAYLAHGGIMADGNEARAINPLFGQVFGSIYDLSTVVILSLA